jgi:hypothetical protein
VSITGVLEDAEQPADNLGAHDIFERVAQANGVLTAVTGDSGNVLGSLKNTNQSLHSICQKTGPC